MIGKTLTFVTAASTLLIVSVLPSPAEPAAPSASRSTRPVWPKWYYYDQLGLREWNKGNKQRALGYFDQSFKLAESDIQGKKALDNATKRMLSDVINHQLFHMSSWKASNAGSSRNASLRETITKGSVISPQEREQKLRFLNRVETFAKRALGPKHLQVQAIERNRLYIEPQHDEKAIHDTQGKPARQGVVEKPKWYTNNERDFTPEMFTRERRKPHEEGSEAEKRMDVTKTPTVRAEKGFTYVAGKKINTSRPTATEKGWAGSSTVGSVERNNPNTAAAGWGAQGPANISDQNATGKTKWGIGAEGISRGGNKEQRHNWGQGNQEDSVFNKPWGAGSGEQDTQK